MERSKAIGDASHEDVVGFNGCGHDDGRGDGLFAV
jgi:hypothetical protein